jgi:hypothetical protein
VDVYSAQSPNAAASKSAFAIDAGNVTAIDAGWH